MDVQAGSHPASFNTTIVLSPGQGDLKDARLELPPGLIGNPDATPKCTYQEFAKQEKAEPTCANSTAIGVATSYLYEASGPEMATPFTEPVYNLVPPNGVVAEFGFIAAKDTPVLLTSSVRTGGDYGLTTTVSDVNQAVLVRASKVTIWGVPAAESHNLIRGECERAIGGDEQPVEEVGRGLRDDEDELETPTHQKSEETYNPEIDKGLPEPTSASEKSGGCESQGGEVPLLTEPTVCGVPRVASLAVDSWEEPGVFEGEALSMPEIGGCGALDFSPTIGFSLEKSSGSTPSGLTGDIRVPQESVDSAVGLAEGTLRDTTVSLPAGVQVNPSSANGLQACTEQQIGYLGQAELDPIGEPGVMTARFTPGQASCPSASKVANVKIKTPVLEGELEGGMYLAAPQNDLAGIPENPFSSLLALYLVAEEPQSGVLVKLAGRITANESTGQLTTTFEQTPSQPFSDLHLQFFGGERSPLATPSLCGNYQTAALLTPWSPGTALERTSDMTVTSGPGGGACASSPLSFKPSFQAGSSSREAAGSYAPFALTIARSDGSQALKGFDMELPSGLAARLSSVPLCGEPAAAQGTCGQASQIGESTVYAGLGNTPFELPGKVYLTGPYDGAPFGLSTVTSGEHVGPFNIGRIVVRSTLRVNETTAAANVNTEATTIYNPSGGVESYAGLPEFVKGLPAELKRIDATINRPEFTFDPTNCNATAVTGTLSGHEGTNTSVSSPFQVGHCSALPFKPQLTSSTAGRASKVDGASLHVRITSAGLGQANIAKVDLQLPKQLPARLTTLQKACTAAQFDSNPAGCPSASNIGTAIVHTPVLRNPLMGPLYLVSHGGEAFPDVEIILQGEGVRVILDGKTQIKKGITYNRFETVPDVPFTSFEAVLPRGKYSIFGANLPGKAKYNLCGQALSMPTMIAGQNGAMIKQTTKVGVTGCVKAKTAKKATRHGKPGKKQ